MTAETVTPMQGGPVLPGETFLTFTDPETLADGHPLRGSRCVQCAAMVGGRPVRFASVVIAGDPGCLCGAVATYTRLVCAEHGEPLAEELVPLCIRSLVQSHGKMAHL